MFDLKIAQNGVKEEYSWSRTTTQYNMQAAY